MSANNRLAKLKHEQIKSLNNNQSSLEQNVYQHNSTQSNEYI